MSHTYRKYPIWVPHLSGIWYAGYTSYIPHKNRDKKSFHKPNKEFKTLSKRRRRAQIREALRNGDYDNIPRHKHNDVWEWN
jgi:hypothetical protein